jgi:hypothetical protein
MGQFVELRIGKLILTLEKNHLSINHSCLFTKYELTQIPSTYDDDNTETKKGFCARFCEILPRLELLGYSKEVANKKFDNQKKEYLDKYSEAKLDITFEDLCNLSNSIDVNFSITEEYLYNMEYQSNTVCFSEYSDFAVWYLYIKNNKKIIIENSEMVNYDIPNFLSELDPYVVLTILSNNQNVLKEYIVWDYMDLVDGGYIKDDVFEENDFDKYLIVTEGSSDTCILKTAFDKIKPNISHFFEFIDMKENYPFTGTGNLVNFYHGLCKINRLRHIIFIFDNDLEGNISARKCKALSKYIKIMNLPILEELTDFSCLGPEGAHNSDINEKAVSIELFLDLNYKNEIKPQIRWETYNEKSKSYQGALINKEKYTRLFFQGINDEEYNKKKLVILLEKIIEVAKSFNNV